MMILTAAAISSCGANGMDSQLEPVTDLVSGADYASEMSAEDSTAGRQNSQIEFNEDIFKLYPEDILPEYNTNLNSGENYLYCSDAEASRNLYYMERHVGWDLNYDELTPVYEVIGWLEGVPGEMSYVIFGVEGLPDNEDVLSVQLVGNNFGDEGEYYVAVSDRYDGDWRISGPFSGDDEAVNVVRTNMFSESGEAVIAIITYGQSLDVQGLKVNVGIPL
jgi:hypothetical protein